MIVPTVMRGLSDAYGSWKIICIVAAQRPQRRSGELRDVLAVEARSSRTVGVEQRMSRRAVVDLPQPDSPTMPSVSPRRTSKMTPSTACTAPTSRWSRSLA